MTHVSKQARPTEEAYNTYNTFEVRSTQYGQGLALFLLNEYLIS